jgi:hypothetical protein
VLRPQERLAMLLSGRGSPLLCEELALRARLDLDGGRLELAAIELERAYAAALTELPAEQREDLRERIEELRRLSVEVEQAAHVALPSSDSHALPDGEVVERALGRLEAALRARTAAGFTVR